ncbi:MAG: hypothetical protein JXA11_14130 [Phycisphaerae bacterium]|nr:hypothetical protein [Phycisphaerae bacterium]
MTNHRTFRDSWKSAAPRETAESPAKMSPRTISMPPERDVREMIHDLKNLLTPILGYAQLVLNDLPPDDAQYQRIEKIRHAAVAARELVMRSLENDANTGPRLPLQLNERVRAVVKLADGLIPGNVRVETYLDEDLRTLHVNPGDLQRLLMNLIANAVQAMPDGGTLRIRTRHAPASRRPAGMDRPFVPVRDAARITVQDTGGGIPPEVIEKIFESGFTTKSDGNGLGLATVRRIVDARGGWIRVESVPGEGTTMHVYLPYAKTASLAKAG